MGYSGLSGRVVDDVVELNRRFLNFAATDDSSAAALPAGWRLELSSVEPAVRERLAQAPFLLLDVEAIALEPAPDGDLFAERRPEAHDLWLTALGFCRQLARSELFSLRVVSGASDDWCARLRELPFAHLADRVRALTPAPRPALADEGSWWSDYIAAAAAGDGSKLLAVRMAGLQHRLCRDSDDTPLGLAACRLERPSRRLRAPTTGG